MSQNDREAEAAIRQAVEELIGSGRRAYSMSVPTTAEQILVRNAHGSITTGSASIRIRTAIHAMAERGELEAYAEGHKDWRVIDSAAQETADIDSPTPQNMKWDVFLSHASEDKEEFARPLAKRLEERGFKVWFDEFALTVGDSLRQSIDRGLAQSRFGVVVISHNFLQKDWPQRELNGLVAREVGGTKVILPVWHKVAADDVRAYSPILADRLSIASDKGLNHVTDKLVEAIRKDKKLQPGTTETALPDRMGMEIATHHAAGGGQPTTLEAVTAAKQLMSEARFEIRLHEFVLERVQESFDQMGGDGILDGDGPWSKDEFQRRLIAFEQAISTPVALFAAAAYWNCSNRVIQIAFEKYLSLSRMRGAGRVYCHELKRYPAIASYYVAGIAGLLGGHLTIFAKMSEALQAASASAHPLANLMWADSPFESLTSSLQEHAGLEWLGVQRDPAGSERILSFLAPLIGEYVSDNHALVGAFDRFEYIVSLIHADYRILYEKSAGQEVLLWMPTGSYIYRNQIRVLPRPYVSVGRSLPATNVVAMTNGEITEMADRWPPIAAGLFGRSLERVHAAVKYAESFFTQHKISF